MIPELDTVVLTRDIDEHGLKEGGIGAVVHCYRDEFAFEVEFVTADGKTIAVPTLGSAEIRTAKQGEILHVRTVAGD